MTMRLDTDRLARYLGTGRAICEAERYRLSLRPFTIPWPHNGSLVENPFGMILTGDRALDYQRVHIRIAAVQAGLFIDIPDGGHLYYRNDNISGLQYGIMRYSKALDDYALKVWYGGKIMLSTEFIPWGFYKEDWDSAEKIQQWIIRSNPEDNEEYTESEASVPMEQEEDPINFSDWLQDWVLE